MDESGTHDGSPVVTVGSYVASPKQWRLWTRDWNATKAPIQTFRSTDCEGYHGEFEGWDKPKRDAYVARLLPVIPRFRLTGLVLGINLNDYHAAFSGRDDVRKLLGTPYMSCFHWAVSDILERHPNNRRIAFVHENNDYQGEASTTFKHLQSLYKAEHRTTLTFGSKQQYTPLQAADIIAFEGNKRLRGPLGRPPRRSWIAIDPPSGPVRATIRYYNKDNMPELVARASAAAASSLVARSS
jgi:hypothetical protein